MSPRTHKKTDAAARIVETAERLFYADGIRAVGIDRIIAEAGVAKMTLYHHFPSKDDLILAVLEYREKQVEAMFTEVIERHARKGTDRLRGFFAALTQWFESEGFRGCSFINARVELADPDHPASKFSAGHKERFHAMLEGILKESLSPRSAAKLAPAIALLVEGAIIMAVMAQSSAPAKVARDTALDLVARASA
jgi:AcrR family transcriptional regulator